MKRPRDYHPLLPGPASRLLCLALTMGLANGDACAEQHRLRTHIAKYDDTPVIVQTAAVQLTQAYEDPEHMALMVMAKGNGTTRRSGVRYLNRLGHEVAVYRLEGALSLKNPALKAIEAMQITTILLNVFHERIGSEHHLVMDPLPPYRTQRIEWSQTVPNNEEVYDVYVVVTKVRFDDGTIWSPREELLLTP